VTLYALKLQLKNIRKLTMHPKLPTVAHIVSIYLPLTQNWIYNQIRFLNRWRSIVLCKKLENVGKFPLDNIYSLKSLPRPLKISRLVYSKAKGYFPYYWHIVKTQHVKFLHAHFGPMGYQSLSLARKARIPLVTTFYGSDLSRLPNKFKTWRKRYRKLYEKGDYFFVEGPYMRQQLIKLGCPPEKIHIQQLGVDLSKLPFEIRKISNDGIVRILVAATFAEKKGLPYAVDAFGRVSKIYPNVQMTIIGDSRDRPNEKAIKKKLQELVAHYHCEEKVTFLGYQPYNSLLKQFYNHHIFLSPSIQASDGDNEGGVPVTIIEASATGMPVISTRHCDIPSVIKHGISGFLVEEKDVKALVDALINLVEDPKQWVIMGHSGRKHVEQEFDIKKTVFELEEKYNSLLL
jgi:colanic acid/amylovoran biosynthesis glycosyltransferase